jgi:tetratricopeptide (TPR) repeat protein
VLTLPDGATVDLEAAEAATERAEEALAAEDWRAAWDDAAAAREVAERGFLPGMDGAWVEDCRRDVEELRLRALDCLAAAGIALGGAELGTAERAARELIEAAPFRESGQRLLMEALTARGDAAEALQVYDRLRVLLRDELGAAPGPAVQALHSRLLSGADRAPEPPPPAEAAPAPPASEERKLVTALAIQLAAPTPIDPEEMRAEADLVRSRLAQELDRFGGSLERLQDDSGLALFGTPTAHEDDAQRAVRAALRLCEAGLASGAGVATGEVLVADTAVTGRVAAEAERLQRSGAPSGVSVDELTWRATRAAVEYEDRDGMRIARGLRSLESRERTPLVGRAHELALLETLHRTVLEERRPRLVAVIGQAGVGKTRLAEELVIRLAATAVVHRGRCLAYGEGIAWWPLREILWEAAGILLDDTGDAAAAKLERRVRALVAEPEDATRVACALAISAGITLSDNPLERMSPESVAEEVGLAWPRFLTALAAEAPAVIVIEDLHWAEPPLIEMVERMLDRSSGPLLVVATARPEFAESRPAWSSRAGIAQVALEPLTDAQSHQLVGELLPAADARLRDRIVSTAEGNPFFAEEIVRHVAEEGDDAGPIPDTIRTLLAARIDRLAEPEKLALQDAAVVGRAFWGSALESMGRAQRLAETLGSLEDKGLVVTRSSSSLPGQTELWFRHGLTREVAYRSIPRAQRCRAHADVAVWMAELAGDRREEFIDLLAYHYEAAASAPDADLAWPPGSSERDQLRGRALEALVEAGHAARRRLALDQAIRFADRALALSTSAHERCTALELKGRAYHAAVRGEEALAAYGEAMDMARAAGDEEHVKRLRAHALLLCIRYAGAFASDDWREHAVAMLEDGLAREDERASTFESGALLLARSWADARWSDELSYDLVRAQRDAARAVEIAEAVDSPDLLASSLEGLTWLVLEDGLSEAGAMGERLLTSGEKLADLAEIHESMVTASMCFTWAGDFERAAALAADATARAARLSPHRALHAAGASTVCLSPAGGVEQLREATRPMAELARDEGDRLCSTGAMGLAGHIWCLFESRDPAAPEALEMLVRNWPGGMRGAYGHRGSLTYPAAEILRPFAPAEVTRRLLDRKDPRRDLRVAVQRLRVELPLVALGAERERLDPLVADARQLAASASAPALGWIADWAEGVGLARAGDRAEGLARVAAATGALMGHGERYTAARLVVDALPYLEGPGAQRLADLTAKRLEEMGALASAAQGRAALTPAAAAPR